MIDLNKIKQRIIASLYAEMYGMREDEADFLRKLGYPEAADELEEWEVYLPQMDGSENLLRESCTPTGIEDNTVELWTGDEYPPRHVETWSLDTGEKVDHPTRLERQARGELEEIREGDWVTSGSGYRPVKVTKKAMDGYFVDVGGGKTHCWHKNYCRLATPQEVLDALESENAHLHRQIGIIEDLKKWLYERGSAMMGDGALEEIEEMIVTYDYTHEEALSYNQKLKQGEEEEIECSDRMLRMQAEGLFAFWDIGEGRWVIDESSPPEIGLIVRLDEDEELSHIVGQDGSRFCRLNKEIRLATPRELLEAGLIDEIPAEEERHCTDHRAAEVVVRDANGEVLEVGDFVVDVVGGVGIVSSFYFHNGDWWIRFGNKVVTDYTEPMTLDEIEFHLGDRAAPDVKKTTTLTHDQYIPLARRTMPDDMTRRERLGMLTRGVCGEYGELSVHESVEEIGDLLWYASLLVEEVGVDSCNFESFGCPIVWLKMDGNRRDEALKKAIYHDVDTYVFEELAAEAMLVCQRSAESAEVDLGEVRMANIKKLLGRYENGFVLGGGER